jgi:hypothetical protein
VITNLPAILRGRAIKENVDMDELISKRAVIEAIEKARANVGHNLERSIGKSIIEILDDVGRDVDRLPPAEPQIIRCKDCKHYKYGMCMKICANKSTNGFCDWGERTQ